MKKIALVFGLILLCCSLSLADQTQITLRQASENQSPTSVRLFGEAAEQAKIAYYQNNPIKESIPDPNVILQGGEDVDDAVAITTLPYTDGGTTAGHINDYDETCPYSGGTAPDVVYSYTATIDTYLVADLCNSLYDTKLYIYVNVVTPNLPYACNDDVCGSDTYKSQLEYIRVTVGNVYYFIVDGYGASSGTYTFNVAYDEAPPSAPPNDTCQNVIPEPLIVGTPLTFTGDNTGSTNDCASFPGGNTWHAFTLTECMDVTLDYCTTSPAFGNAWLNLAYGCPCDSFTAAGAYDFTTCGDGNVTIQWLSLQPGTYYYPVLLDPANSAQGPYTLHVSGTSCYPPPPNDNCVDVVPVALAVGSPLTFTGNTLGSTNDCSLLSLPQAWHAFTTTVPLNVTIDFCTTSPAYGDAFIVLIDGCPCASTRAYSSYNDTICGDGNLTINWINVPAGTYYYPVILNPAYSAAGPYTIHVTASIPPPPPANDSCIHAEAVGAVSNLPFSTTYATFDGGGLCMTSPNVWYLYTAAGNDVVTVHLCGSLFDTKLAVYDGSTCDPLPVELFCNDDSCGLQSGGQFVSVMGNSYLIEVGGYSSNAGDGYLTIETGSPVFSVNPTSAAGAADIGATAYDSLTVSNLGPAMLRYSAATTQFSPLRIQPGAITTSNYNPTPALVKVEKSGYQPNPNVILQGGDAFGDAMPIPSLPYTDNGTTSGYIDDYIEFCTATSTTPSPDVVYSFAPIADTTIVLSTAGTAWDTKIYVYDGPDTANLVGCNDDFGGVQSQLTQPILAGHTYYIVVDGYGGAEGPYDFFATFSIECIVVCPPGSTLETETCGDSLNDGCNGTPYAFEPITFPDTLCGTAWANTSLRDTDWYIFTLATTKMITYTGTAEFPLLLFIVDAGLGDCSNATILASATADPCSTATIAATLPPGTYYLWAGPSVWDNIPCDGSGAYGNDYVISFKAAPAWLSVTPITDSIPGGDPSKIVEVVMNATDMVAGVYTGQVTFTTNDLTNPSVVVPVTFTVGSSCAYVVGDINNDNLCRGSDVTYAVRYFKGLGPQPADSCYDVRVTTPTHWLYVGGDVNGDCQFKGSDVTRLVSYFKGLSVLVNCSYFPAPLARPTPIIKLELGE